jgi:hypothetical protein
MSYKNPMVKFFGTQKSGKVSPAKVPFREPERPSTGVLNVLILIYKLMDKYNLEM